LDHGPGGRTERRLPIILVVRLVRAELTGAVGDERIYTDNLSPRGVRLFSNHAWQLGDTIQVAPLSDDSVCGKMVYCQKLAEDRYGIGVHFQDRSVEWFVLEKYGVLIG